MILVDTSVIIDFARGRDARLMQLLPTVAPAVCGIVRAELLCGTRDARHGASLRALLSPFQVVPISERRGTQSAKAWRHCEGRGSQFPSPMR